ncbi:MAG: hypothetical protein CVV42_08865 [Candidatus Riflebacteria bacterium HGW-Riflebacteria-2]|jgi:hypothetical protein|nr:MAG: hypothetical protein CVV42_08865 [Candidatus Riflebacteria bacterium HGW-Riflebacteria-2]
MTVFKHTFVALLLCIVFASTCPAADDFNFATRQIANFSDYPQAFESAGLLPGNEYALQSLTRVIHHRRSDRYRLKIELELTSQYSTREQQNAISAGWQVAGSRSGFKAFKTDTKHAYTDRWQSGSELERCEIAFTAGELDIQLGRQPVSFGTSHFVPVLDVLAPFNPGYLDSSYKAGIDALRIRKIAGTTGEMELIAAAARASEDSAVIGRYRDTFSGFDVEALAGRFRRRNFVGLGWEGERRRINIWGEAALFERNSSDGTHLGGFSNDLAGSWSIGFEKSIAKHWRAGIACLHQDFGARKTGDLTQAYASKPFRQGWMKLAASDYLIVSSNRDIGPLSSVNINAMINLVDNSTLWQPVWRINTSDESDISFFAWFNTGRSTALRPTGLELRSEFGAFASGIGMLYSHFY